MNNELLPIGSVVLIGNSKKKVMIVGVCQKGGQDPNAIWDYTGVIFPEQRKCFYSIVSKFHMYMLWDIKMKNRWHLNKWQIQKLES